jgi:hypothetical protein
LVRVVADAVVVRGKQDRRGAACGFGENGVNVGAGDLDRPQGHRGGDFAACGTHVGVEVGADGEDRQLLYGWAGDHLRHPALGVDAARHHQPQGAGRVGPRHDLRIGHVHQYPPACRWFGGQAS